MGKSKRIPIEVDEFYDFINETDDMQRSNDIHGFTRYPIGKNGKQDYRKREEGVEVKNEPLFRRWDWTDEESSKWTAFRNEYAGLYKQIKDKTPNPELKKQLDKIITGCRAYEDKNGLI